MSLVFKTPLNAKNLTSRGSQNIDSPFGCNLEEGSVEYTENGEYTLEPESADGFSSVAITVDVPSDVNNQSKEATPTTSAQEIEPDASYTGLSKVTIAAVTASIDANISAGNIKKDVEILGVTGSYDPQPSLQAKSANPTTSQQVIEPDQDKDGLSSVTISGVTAAIDANIAAGNIKKDVTILGVTGSYEPALQAKTVSSSTSQQVVEADSPNYGLSSVTVEPYVLQAKTATPTTSQQLIEADNDKDGLSSVTISAVTSSIDANIAAGNIKKDVTILGVTGSYDPQPTLTTLSVTPTTSAQTLTPSQEDGWDEVDVAAVDSTIDANILSNNIKNGVTILGITGSYTASPNLQDKTVTPTTSQQVISADGGYDGLNDVTVSAVTSAIDNNITAGNIKDGVTILGVTGSYTGGGSNVPDWSLIGWSSSDVTASGIVDDLTTLVPSRTVFLPKTINVTSSGSSTTPYLGNTNLVYGPANAVLNDSRYLYDNFFKNCSNLKNIDISSNYPQTSAVSMFEGCSKLQNCNVDMTGVTDASSMFKDAANNLPYNVNCNITLTNTDDIVTVTQMFGDSTRSGDKAVTLNFTLPAVTDASYMFYNTGFSYFRNPAISFGNGTLTKTSYMFAQSNIKTLLDNFDTSGVTDMNHMFHKCSGMTTVPSTFNTSSCTNMSYMFSDTRLSVSAAITPMASWDTSNVTDFSYMFYTQFYGYVSDGPAFDMSNAENVSYMFGAASSVASHNDHEICPQYNWGKVKNVLNCFAYATKLATVGGFVNLGKAFLSTDPSNYHNLDIRYTSVITKASVMNVINNLAAPDDTNCNDATLTLSATSYALLDASDIAVATAKNWSVTSA